MPIATVRSTPLALLVLSFAHFTGCAWVSSPVRNLENRLIYQPTVFPDGDYDPRGLEFEDAWFTADDGTRLHGWFCGHPNPRATLLVAHGNAGNLSHRQGLMRRLQHRLGVQAMIFDYRGYGRSEGAPSEEGVLMDARAARRWLSRRTGVGERDMVLLGRSLGGGVMVDLAARDGARGLILESTFTSMRDVAARQFPYTPVRYVMSNQFDSKAKIGDYHGPLLQSHGVDDTLIPLAQAQALHQRASGQKQFLAIPGGDHNWLPTSEYLNALDRFIESLPPPNQRLDRRADVGLAH